MDQHLPSQAYADRVSNSDCSGIALTQAGVDRELDLDDATIRRAAGLECGDSMPLPKKIVLASGNVGKLREIERILGDLDVEIVPQSELEGDMSDAQMGLQARLMSQALRKLSGD